MSRLKKGFTPILALFLALMLISPLQALADDGSTEANPHVGGYDYGDTDYGGQIILHKLDIAAFEHAKAVELIAAGQLADTGSVTYWGAIPTGGALSASSVVGTYTTTDAPGTHVDVTLDELATLANISFRIEEVKLSEGNTPGSTDPEDYEPVASGINGYAKTDSSGTIAWEGLAKGYYRITEISGDTARPVGASTYIVSLPMVDPANEAQTIDIVHLYPKNRADDGPVIVKEKPTLADHNGNILSWTIKAEIPSVLKPEKGVQHYAISDTMSNGIVYANNMTVYYLSGGTPVELTKDTHYSTDAQNGGSAFTITLEADGFTLLGSALPDGIDKDANDRFILYVTYDTVVNLSEEDFQNSVTPENEVELDFTNSDGTAYKDSPGPTLVEDYAGLRLIKKDGSDESIVLSGVQFKVYTALNTEESGVENSSVLKNALGEELVFTTDSNGRFFAGGLGAGDYYIVELDPPAGYKKLTGFQKVTITEADVADNAVIDTTVFNYRDNGLSLPETGGMGTIIFIVVGAALIFTAIALLAAARKRNQSCDGD